MKKFKNRLKAVVAVCFILGLVGFSGAEELTFKVEKRTYFYKIEVNDKSIFEIPMDKVKTVTKEEWRDIELLIDLIKNTHLDEETTKSLVNTIAPKRFITKAN